MRKLFISLIVFIAMLFMPYSASAYPVFWSPNNSPIYDHWVRNANVPTPTSEVLIGVIPQRCNIDGVFYAGCASFNPRVIWVSFAESNFDAKRIFMHELGHHFDDLYMNDARKQIFYNKTGMSGPWVTGHWYSSPHQAFAESYKACSFPNLYSDTPAMYVTDAEEAAVCRWIRNMNGNWDYFPPPPPGSKY